MARLRTSVRGLLWVGLGVVGSALAAVALIFLLLATGAGNSFASKRILAIANHAFRGRLVLASAQVFPDGAFDIRGAEILGTDGHRIARAKEVRGRIELTQLLRQRVRIHDLDLLGGSLSLVQGTDGELDLVTALSPRTSSPAVETKGPQPGWSVAIDVSRLEADRFVYVLTGSTLVEVDDTSLRGGFELKSDSQIAITSAVAQARLITPMALPFAGQADLHISPEGTLTGQASVRSGQPGEPELRASAKLEGDALTLSVEAVALDLHALRPELPHSHLSIEASASGPFHLSGDLRLTVLITAHDSTLEGVPFSGDLHATVASTGTGGTLLVQNLELNLAGASLQASGQASVSSLQLEGKLTVSDAAKLTRSLLPDLVPPPVKGRLTAVLAAKGAPNAPRLNARILTPGLVVAGVKVGPTGLSTALAFSHNFERLSVQTLQLSLSSGRWTLVQPVTLEFHEGLHVPPFELDSEPQRLRAEATITGSAIDVHAELTQLDLARLPPSWVPASLGLAGVAEAKIDYQRRKSVETLHGNLSLKDAVAHGVKIEHAAAELEVSEHRLSGTLAVQTPAGGLRGQLEGPAHWPLGTTDGPLAAKVEVEGLALAELRPVIPALSDWDGTANLTVELSGSTRRPKLALHGSGQQVAGPWVPPTEPKSGDRLELAVDALWDERLTSRLTVARTASRQELVSVSGNLALPVPEVLGRLLQGTRSLAHLKQALLDAPLSLAITSKPMDLQETAGLLRTPAGIEGKGAVEGTVEGTLARPRGKIELRGNALVVNRHPLGNLQVEVVAHDRAIDASGGLALAEGSLQLTAHVGEPPEVWLARRVPLAVPIEAHVTLSSLPLRTVVDLPAHYQATLTGQADFEGSLETPRARARLRLEDSRLATKSLGTASLDLTWENARIAAKLEAIEPSGGRLTAQLAFPFAVGDRRTDRALTGALVAQTFDLALFEEATPALHLVEGILDANLALGGSLHAPRLTGALSINEGSLAIAGHGLFQDIVLAATISPDAVTLDRLTVRSGRGTAQASGSLTRAEKGFALQANVSTDRFAIYMADLLQASLTSDSELTGTLWDEKNQLELKVKSAEIAIPTLTPKPLAPISLDSDIIMVGQSKPPARVIAHPLTVHVLAQGPLSLTGPDVRLNGKAELWALFNPDLTLKGTVLVSSGGVSLFGRTFVVNRASAEFGDLREGSFGAPDDPLLSARASTEASGTKVFVQVDGRLPSPTVDFTSEPPMSEDRLITLLLGGAPESGSQQSAALSPLTNLLVNQALGSKGPLDVMSVSATHVEAGKQLNDQLYLSGAYNNDPDPRANQFEARLSYRLGKSWTVDGKYGTSGAGAVNVEWRTDW